MERWKDYFIELTNTGKLGKHEDEICNSNEVEGREEEETDGEEGYIPTIRIEEVEWAIGNFKLSTVIGIDISPEILKYVDNTGKKN